MTALQFPEPGLLNRHGRQSGVTLIVSLLFLLLLTILGVTALNTSTLQEKMAGNLRDQDLAFQAAESALRFCEARLPTIAYPNEDARTGDATGSTGIWASGIAQPLDDAWWSSNSIEFGSGSLDLGLPDDPRCSIEFVQEPSTGSARPQTSYSNTVSTEHYYRITSRAVGITRNSRSMLESHYRIKFN